VYQPVEEVNSATWAKREIGASASFSLPHVAFYYRKFNAKERKSPPQSKRLSLLLTLELATAITAAMSIVTPERHSVKHRTPLNIMCTSFPLAYEKPNGYWTQDDNPHFDFREEEDGHISIHSWTGRTAEQVLAMGNPPLKLSDLYPKDGDYKPAYREKQFDLVTLAQYMKLPHRFLFREGYRDGYTYRNKNGRKTVCVKLGGFCDPDGNEHSKVKVRLSIDGKVRFLWDKNTPGEPIPCGLHRLDEARRAGYLIAGEGESDAATMWFHGFPFLGIGGADAVKQLDVALLHAIPRIYIIEEPDQAAKNQETGQGFYAALREHLRAGGYAGEIFSIRFKLATGYKDPSNLHKACFRACDLLDDRAFLAELKAQFTAAIEKAMDLAIPEGNTALATQEDVQDLQEPAPAHPATQDDRMQWFAELCAVSSDVLSPAHKIVLMVIILHSPIWNTTGEHWWQVDADLLAEQAAMPKKTFLKHLTYLTDKVELFTKRHVQVWYSPMDARKKACRTELYIQPAEHTWLTYPSTYKVTDGTPERNHGGTRIPKPKCVQCGSEDLDIDEVQTCRNCNRIHIIHKQEEQDQEEEQAPVESTAEVLPIEHEEENTPEKYSGKSNLGIIDSLSLHDTQVAPAPDEKSTPENIAEKTNLGFPVVLPARMTICCNAPFQRGPTGAPECSNPACPEKQKRGAA
jgi:hypothetical protein